ncbi:hypothetical protein Nmel_000657 [Mimus melanotis]
MAALFPVSSLFISDLLSSYSSRRSHCAGWHLVLNYQKSFKADVWSTLFSKMPIYPPST